MAGTELVGRAEELVFVTHQLEDLATAGALIMGPPGVGKTRLAREAIAPIAAGPRRVFHATATRSGATLPFGVVIDLLPPAAAEQSRVELIQSAMNTVREAGTGPDRPVIMIDDAHLVDEGTAMLLLQLAERELASLLLTIRTGEVVPDPITALWKDDFAVRIDLQPISPAETAQLTQAILAGGIDDYTAEQIWAVTGGNPLYISEVVRAARVGGALREVGGSWHWHGGLVPDGQLVDAVAVHLHDMGEDVRDVMQLLAVGESLPRVLLESVAGAEALAETEDADLALVDPRTDRVQAAHPLFAEVVRATMAATKVDRARERLARAALDLDLDLDREVNVVTRAIWFLALPADESDPAAQRIRTTLADGATSANRLGDYALAERLARHALEHQAGAQAALALAIALGGQSRPAEADAVFLSVIDTEMADSWKPGLANMHVGLRVWALDDLPGALDVLARWTEGVTDPEARDALEAERANILASTGGVAEALAIAAPIIDDQERSHLARCRAFEPLALAAVQVGRTDHVAEIAPGLALRAMSLRQVNSMAPTWIATGYFAVLVARGGLEEAIRLIDLVESATPTHDDKVRALVTATRGFIDVRAGRARSGYDLLRHSVAIGTDRERNLPFVTELAGLAEAAALCGDANAARDACDRAAEAIPRGSVFAGRLLQRIAARVRFAEGDLEGARRLSEEGAASCRTEGLFGLEAAMLDDAVRFGARGAVLDRLIDLGPMVDGPMVAATVRLATGLRTNDPDPVEQAATAFGDLGCLLDAAEAATLAAGIHRRAGRPDLAVAAAARAQAWFGQCAGARSPIVFDQGIRGEGVDLTRREREIALAAAGGLSNREIAGNLTVSVRTVEGHLSRIYNKLGVNDRAGLAAVLGPR